MNLAVIQSFFNKQKRDNLCFLYQGEFNDDITDRILSMSEYNLDNIGSLKKLKRKISFLMAESFQNIIRHGDSHTQNEKSGLFFARNIENSFYISSANTITDNQIEDLRNKIDKINELSEDELKNVYINVLANDDLSEKGGAGLGLIAVARKSGHGLDYTFEPLGNNKSLFYLGVKLKNTKVEEETTESKTSISDSQHYYSEMKKNNILISYKGDFSSEAFSPILTVIKDNLEVLSDNSTTKKRVFMALLEVSQNIYSHSKNVGDSKEGILMISKTDDSYTISAGNYVSSENATRITHQLDLLNQLTKNELRELYQDTLKLSDANKLDTKLGLIDMARDAQSDIQYSFEPVDATTQFFTFSISF